MNREVCGICWCPYDDNGACGCKPQTGEGMTTDELIDLAHKAGNPAITRYGLAVVTIKWMESFAALVAAAEREECAQVCEARFMGDLTREDMEARRCAAAIRARGEQP